MKIFALHRKQDSGIMLLECLTYLAGLMVVMGLAYGAYYRCVVSSTGMRKNGTDITKVLQSGERWREDVRNASGNLSVTKANERQTVRIPQKSGTVIYVFENGTVKRSGDEKKWISILSNVKASRFEKEERKQVVAWRWEVELNARKESKMRPLFTFQVAQIRK